VADPKKDAATRGREVADLIDRMVAFLIIACPCGVRIKVPPDLKRDEVRCTRCGRQHAVPHAEGAKAGKAQADEARAERDPEGPPSLRYERQGSGWESFKCSCGSVVQISPAFEGNELTCRKCRQRIRIE
jgi:heat shock protein HtpX